MKESMHAYWQHKSFITTVADGKSYVLGKAKLANLIRNLLSYQLSGKTRVALTKPYIVYL
jgi:hypothetical protein